MPSADKRNKIIIVVIGSILLIGYIIVSIYLAQKKNKAAEIDQQAYHDPYSGETITDTKGKAPEIAGLSDTDRPVYLGTSKLLAYGLSDQQVQAYKEAIYQFSKTKNLHINEVSIDVKSISQTQNDQSITTTTFSMITNRKDHYVTSLSYSGITDLTTSVADTQGAVLFTYAGTN